MDVVRVDAVHDQTYFTEAEQAEIHDLPQVDPNVPPPVPLPKVWHQEDDSAPLPDPDPRSAGLSQEQLDTEGICSLPNFKAAVIKHQCNQIPLPPEDHEARQFYWRTSWSRRDDVWRLLKDEVRWKDLSQPSPRVEASDCIVALYFRSLGDHQARRMRHFPGLQQVSLERLVKRAHDGLGHPSKEPLSPWRLTRPMQKAFSLKMTAVALTKPSAGMLRRVV